MAILVGYEGRKFLCKHATKRELEAAEWFEVRSAVTIGFQKS